MAISGAAANPNCGYHTSGPMAFLLTVFNARLGWWLGNPRWADREQAAEADRSRSGTCSPSCFGQTTGAAEFVNLSDGGHFDNLGLYELVRRRCRFIIVCDAEEDGELTFGSLGDAIRQMPRRFRRRDRHRPAIRSAGVPMAAARRTASSAAFAIPKPSRRSLPG